MVFSSLLFVFAFLVICYGLYMMVPGIKARNAVLLLFSLVFYAWGGPSFLILLLLMTFICYLGGRLIQSYAKHKKLWLAGTLILCLGLLGFYKYTGFFLSNLQLLLGFPAVIPQITLPIGISFYTFQLLSYVIDVYRGDVEPERNFFFYALFVSFFPQLVAGPIVKYHDVQKEIEHREVTFDKVAYGVKRFIIGLAKKMLLANVFGAIADKIFNQPVESFDAATAWVGAIAYSLQLYFDFSGYSDMAIGLGAVFGFKFLENFNYPYISRSITEFWRRWHISLSTWFKEYLYIPLGGNRVSRQRTYINLFIVFLATGIWHGASWNFVIWGLWHGLFIILERMTGWHKKEGGWLLNTVKHVYTILIFVIGWVMFRADNMSYAWAYIKNMFGCVGEHRITYDLEYYVGGMELLAFAVAVLCAVPLFRGILTLSPRYKKSYSLVNIWLLVLFMVSAASIAASTYNPFIYFRF